MSTAALIGVCLSEHERRFVGYDARLLRPTVMPQVMRLRHGPPLIRCDAGPLRCQGARLGVVRSNFEPVIARTLRSVSPSILRRKPSLAALGEAIDRFRDKPSRLQKPKLKPKRQRA
jgi:hypothetical protein